MDPLRYKIRGSGIRGFKYHKNDWVAKKNTILEVRLDDSKCLVVYTDQNIRAGTIAEELQKDLREFLYTKPSSKITVTVTSSKPVWSKVKRKGKELPCDILLIGEDCPAVMNDILAIQEEIKRLKKEDGLELSGRMMPKMRKKAEESAAAGAANPTDNDRPEETAEAQGADNKDNGCIERLEETSAAGDADNHASNEQSEENAADDDKNADKDENTNSSNKTTKRKMTSDADEPVPKVRKEPVPSTSATQPQLGRADEKILIFRYQFLLVEIGTEVLKALFDNHVGNDLMVYLDAKPTKYTVLKRLMFMKKPVITKSQQELLPPKDKKPSSSNFDITLLSCLLRNICLQPLDPLQADIATLRICRNYLSHSGTVFISKTDFDSKWTELYEILDKLNKDGKCGITDLESKIDAAKDMAIDEKMKERYDTMLKLWDEMDQALDRGIGNLQKTADGIREDVSGVKEDVSIMKKDMLGVKKDVSDTKDNVSKMKKDVSDIAEIKENVSDLKDGQSDLKDKITKQMSEMDEKINQLTKK